MKCACWPSTHMGGGGRSCAGPGLRKGPHWYDKKTPMLPDGLTILPTKGQRWGQIVKAIDREYELHRMKGRNPDPWTQSLQKALDIDFSGRT